MVRIHGDCCPHSLCFDRQVSIILRLPALGLSILQLSKSFDSHNTFKSSVRLFLHGRDLPVHKYEAFPVQVIPTATDDFCLENQHMQVCFSGPSGSLKVSEMPGGRAGGMVGRKSHPYLVSLCFLAERFSRGR